MEWSGIFVIVIIKMMSRWALAFLAFTFFVLTPTMVFVCGSVFYNPSPHDPCFQIPLYSERVLAQTNQVVPVALPLEVALVVGIGLFAAAICDTLHCPTPFTLPPQTPPPRSIPSSS